MGPIEYRALDKVDPEQLLSLLNKERVRSHLMKHPLFDRESLHTWLNVKLQMDSTPGCRVQAIVVDGQCVGWCGIQRDTSEYEIAVVLDDSHWGLGRYIFRQLMAWAKEFGHQTVCIHFLHTRPEYGFLRNMAKRVFKSEIQGHNFTTYTLPVQ